MEEFLLASPWRVPHVLRVVAIEMNGPSANAPVVEEDTEEALSSCRCGTNRESKYSVVHREYSFLGTLYLLWGGTSIPSKVSFGCVKCGAIFESTVRPAVCREHVQ